MKRWIAVLLALVMLLSSMPGHAEEKFSTLFFDYFDTVTSFMGYASSQAEFDQAVQLLEKEISYLHQLFDGYHLYGDMHNLRYVNENAALAPVQVDEPFFTLLSMCKEMYGQPAFSGVNIAMGSVLSLWHDARESGILPDRNALEKAALHTDFSKVILDAENSTVYFEDPLLKLDLGAVAKGYAADRIRTVIEPVLPSFLISLGGNVYAGEKPLDGRKKWGVSVQCPDGIPSIQPGSDILEVLYDTRMSFVTSGDYQRFMEVDGVRYHHIIDPVTLMPASHLRGVTIVCESGFMADYLSTLLFTLPYEEGFALIESIPDAGALFITSDGAVSMTDDVAAIAYTHGASAR